MKKNIVSTTTALLMAGMMVFSPVSAGITNAAQEQLEEPIDGGWQANADALSISKNQSAYKAFKKATEGLEGYSYQAIALLGTQVVSGTNYAILCRDQVIVPDAEPVFEIVYVYEDLDGNAQILGTKELTSQAEAGGFAANSGKVSLKKHTKINKLYKKAFAGLVGASYQQVAYLGRQVVAGTNYLAMFRTTPVVPNPEPYFTLVTVHKDLKGKVSLGEIETIELGEMD